MSSTGAFGRTGVRVFLILVLVAIIVGVVWLLIPSPEGQPPDTAKPGAQASSDTVPPAPPPPVIWVDLGLLAPVKGQDGQPPTQEQFAARYKEIVLAFLPEKADVQPTVEADAESLTFDGPIRVAFNSEIGHVFSIKETATVDFFRHVPGRRESVRDWALLDESQTTEFASALAERLGMSIGKETHIAYAYAFTQLERRRGWLGWCLTYHGYPHLHERVGIGFEVRDGKPYPYQVSCHGGKVPSEKPVISISPEEAARTATKVISQMFDREREERHVDPGEILGVVGSGIAYVHRDDYYKNPQRANIMRMQGETHLCHIVRVKTGERLNPHRPSRAPRRTTIHKVHVDCADGTVVGGKRVTRVDRTLGN